MQKNTLLRTCTFFAATFVFHVTYASGFIFIGLEGNSYKIGPAQLDKIKWEYHGGKMLTLHVPGGLRDNNDVPIPEGTASSSVTINGSYIKKYSHPLISPLDSAQQTTVETQSPQTDEIVESSEDEYKPWLYKRTIKLKGVENTDPEALYWAEGSNPAKEIVYIRKVPIGKEVSDQYLAIPTSVFLAKQHVIPYEQASLVNHTLKSADGISFKAGSILGEVDHNKEFVRVRIVGDASQSIYKIKMSDYLKGNNTRPLRSDEDQKLIDAQIAKFNALNPQEAKAEASIDLGQNDEQKTKNEANAELEESTKDNNHQIPAEIIEAEKELVEESSGKSHGKAKHQEKSEEKSSAGANRWGKFKGTKTDSSVLGSSNCQPKSDYVPKEEASWKTRKFYRPIILEAANKYKVHPAIIEASINIESDFVFLKENTKELEGFQKMLEKDNKPHEYADAEKWAWDNGQDAWGKGICQYGPSICQDKNLNLGLDWLAPKPHGFKVPPLTKSDTDKYNAYVKNNPKSVWNPEAAIMAKAKRYAGALNKKFFIYDSKGKKIDISDQLMGRGLAETARNLLGIFNRGEMVVGSYEAYFRKNGHLPENYGTAWETSKAAGQKKKVLKGQIWNRRHVWYGAGLCGELDPDSLVARFNKEYSYNEKNGIWESLK